MIHLPNRFDALALGLAAGVGLGAVSGVLVTTAPAQTADGSAAAVSAVEMAHTDAKGRHLAPRDTFYVLTYVSAKTDKGVIGFEPGQEVRFVEVRQSTRTLVVTDGKTQVEVQPSQLTNDLDIAALVRQKDQANQDRVAAYIQAEQAAYAKNQKVAAEATANDLEQHRQEKAAENRAEEQAARATPTTQTVASSVGSGYYGAGGYGYGSPYSYFTGGTTTVAPAAPVTAPATTAPASAPASNVAVPSGQTGGGRTPK